MSISRRSVLIKGGVIGAAILSAPLSGAKVFAQTPPTRRNLSGMAWNDPDIASYREAVGIMKAKPDSDPFSWVSVASYHGFYDPNTGNGDYKYCPHGDWYFLPWHRAYVVMYEKLVRSLTGNASFAMPYWDWTSDPYLPPLFTAPTTPDGQPNPLYVNDTVGGTVVTRTWNPNVPIPARYVGPPVLQSILASSPYESFGTSRNPSQTDLNPSWIVAGGGVQGILERTPHNNVHNLIGGWMPSPASPRDPIFFMHHCNIDRIWAVWNLNNTNSTDPLWTNMPFTNNYINPDGSFWSPTVSDLYVPETLGYTYGLPTAVAMARPRTMALGDKLTNVFTTPKGSTPRVAETNIVALDGKAATPAAPLVVSLTLPTRALDTIRKQSIAPAADSIVNFSMFSETRASGLRALAILRDVVITEASTTAFSVFIDRPGLTAQTPETDPAYVGTFAELDHFSGHGGHAGHGGHGKAAPSFLLDLTEALRRTKGPGGLTSGTVALSIFAIPVSTTGTAEGTARPAQVEVLLVDN